MTIKEIKTAVDQGKTVYWASGMYEVVKDKNNDYLIKCESSGSCIGLTNLAGDKLNGKQEDFFVL